MVPANLGSETMSFCSRDEDFDFLLFFDDSPLDEEEEGMDSERKFLRVSERRPSWMAVISSTAEAVDWNRWMASRFRLQF
jgi:hypothetical protein